MKAEHEIVSKNNLRISQLTQRTNQFNARTVRYDEKKLKTFLDKNYFNWIQFKR